MSLPPRSTGSRAPEANPVRKLDNAILLHALQGEAVARAPVWLMRQAGRYLPEYHHVRNNYPNFIDLCRSTVATTELALQPLRRFKLDAAIVFSDILTIPHAMELGLEFVNGIGPRFQKPIRDPKDIYAVPFDEVIAKVSYVFAAVQSLRDALGNRLPLIGFAGSPWTMSCYAINGDGQNQFRLAKEFAYTHPVAMQELIHQLTQVTAHYLRHQAESGADVLFLIDTWGGLLPFELYDIYVLESLKVIHQYLREHNIHQPLLFYSKGYSPLHVEKLFADIPCQGIAIDWTDDLAKTYKDLHTGFAIQGNLDPSVLISGPTVTQQHTWAMLERINPCFNYIASLGHGVLKETPLESIHAFIDTVHSYKAQT